MSAAVDGFVERARAVSLAVAAQALGLKFRGAAAEHPQPCPACGGSDRFAFNTRKSVWNCRGSGDGGHDAIGMAAHCLGLDLKRRDGFLEACAAVLGEAVPDGAERESGADRAARQARLAATRARNLAESDKRDRAQADFRERERARARGIFEAAAPLYSSALPHGRSYLQRRGCGYTGRWLRVSADLPYWHGVDEAGRALAIHSGPAMVAPFVDCRRAIIGCHITWIDLANPPKFRPVLRALRGAPLAPSQSSGRLAAAPAGRASPGARSGMPPAADGTPDPYTPRGAETDQLPTKKMRGSKKGGLIPLAGDFDAARWVGAEGIENALAYANWEGLRADTFYFAAGDLGNLAGPADPASRFAHPTLTIPGRNGLARPLMVQGAIPKPGQSADEALQIEPHVGELVLLGDSDSEPVMTAAAMARARARLARPGLRTFLLWPRRGGDFADMARADGVHG